jgi:hypothetical protein
MSGEPSAHTWRAGPERIAHGLQRVYGRLGRWDSRGWITAAALAVVSIVAIGGTLWGAFVANPDLHVQQYDAGPVSDFAIGKVAPYPDVNIYLVGLFDGRIRAIDGIAKETKCAVQWLPDDTRTSAENPDRAPGAYVDPCSSAVWTRLGNAFSGTNEPLRTFEVEYVTNDEGVQHVWVEVIGPREGKP